MDSIYLDNNATTPLLPAVWEAMRPFLTDIFGNPASAHRIGRRARQALEDARERCALLLGAFPDELVFTSGATEANNLALFGLTHSSSPGHLLCSPIEHPSVAEPIRRLAEAGWTVDYFPVDSTGTVHPEALAGLLRSDTRLVTVMLANHETGTLQPVAALAEQLEGRVPFHCDAVQAAGKVPFSFHDLGVTTLTISAHKFHGPKGAGGLLVRRGSRLPPQMFGGHQQQGRRPGTEAVALAVGLVAALESWHREAEARTKYVRRLRHLLLGQLQAAPGPVVLNG
ncbi:MAG: cysteine desulfurase, partial [Planctomycetes bacterium]|nr:cysteine desulfurase [Planctomycetota bacterium]